MGYLEFRAGGHLGWAGVAGVGGADFEQVEEVFHLAVSAGVDDGLGDGVGDAGDLLEVGGLGCIEVESGFAGGAVILGGGVDREQGGPSGIEGAVGVVGGIREVAVVFFGVEEAIEVSVLALEEFCWDILDHEEFGDRLEGGVAWFIGGGE
ncbi:MAG: hypothetical protein RI897_3944 [Verrucomicrobiota bacterium]